MGRKTSATAIYLEREMLRVEFSNSSIILDHPAATGGGAKGPSPGNLVAGGLLAATLFCAMDNARLLGVRLDSIVARSASRSVREGKEGPLHALAYMSQIWRNLEIEADLNGVDAAQIAGRVGLLETLRDGIELTERVAFIESASPRGIPPPRNPHFLDNEREVEGLAAGVVLQHRKPSDTWHLSATPLDLDTVLVEMPGVPLCVSRSEEPRRGPTPHELLLGGLAACTGVYVGRNAPVHDIPLERIEVTAAADAPPDFVTPIRAIDKVTSITGRLTDSEKEKCSFFADFCAWGETLKRGVEIIDNIVVGDSLTATESRSPLAILERASTPPAECDDGACCVPGVRAA